MNYKFFTEQGKFSLPDMDFNSLFQIFFDRLDPINNRYFIIELFEKINGFVGLQVICYEDYVYSIQTLVYINDVCRKFEYVTDDKNEILNIYMDFFLENKMPDISDWEELTMDNDNIDEECKEDDPE